MPDNGYRTPKPNRGAAVEIVTRSAGEGCKALDTAQNKRSSMKRIREIGRFFGDVERGQDTVGLSVVASEYNVKEIDLCVEAITGGTCGVWGVDQGTGEIVRLPGPEEDELAHVVGGNFGAYLANMFESPIE